MSTATLERVSLEREQVPIRREIRQEIGVSACTGCPFLQKCPGKQDVAQPCPPEAKAIAREEVSGALFDDSIGSIFPASGGGFMALPEKARQFQTAILPLETKPKVPVKKKPPIVSKRATKLERQPRRSASGLMAVLGELALVLFGGTPSESAKK